MARGSRSANRFTIANDPLRSLLRSAPPSGYISERPFVGVPSFSLLDVQDFRVFHPEFDNRPVKTVDGNRTSLVVTPSVQVHRRPILARNYYTNTPVGLQVPVGVKVSGVLPVAMCVRRKIRKSVMFALGKTRKGAGASRRRNERSKVGC